MAHFYGNVDQGSKYVLKGSTVACVAVVGRRMWHSEHLGKCLGLVVRVIVLFAASREG